jgi:DNA-binding MarR family transcriptional regulator
MHPVDYRSATWEGLQARVSGLRLMTLVALQKHGPCTTRDLAAASGIDLLTVRPRITELVQLGLAELAADARGTEGVYRALTITEALTLFARRHAAANAKPVQEELALV